MSDLEEKLQIAAARAGCGLRELVVQTRRPVSSALRQVLQLRGCKGQSMSRFAGALRFAGKPQNQALSLGGVGGNIFAGNDFTMRLGVEASAPLVFS